ncbi:hypothetical protein T10_9341 [Trichinella papuae]|uniref:Uncharacterized protein n=1 Tax=Trichinella papuae TaxID=268474 RepID=A0A0V1LXT4_9BILA|nr:hypothetical protein T10_9341 [Trichinella papuae]
MALPLSATGTGIHALHLGAPGTGIRVKHGISPFS